VLEPGVLHQLALLVRAEVVKVEQRGASPVLVTARPLRRPLRRLLALTEVTAPVLCPDELGPQITIESAGTVSLDDTVALGADQPRAALGG
jgi:flagellar biosynthesis component FlhA